MPRKRNALFVFFLWVKYTKIMNYFPLNFLKYCLLFSTSGLCSFILSVVRNTRLGRT